MNQNPKPLPRIILEQQDDGSIVIEHYINGSRTREPVWAGMFDIKNALSVQKKQIEAKIQRELQKKADEEKARHNRVWQWTAERHGIGFANRTVNGISSLKIRAKKNEDTKKEKVKDTSAEMQDMLSLI